MISGAIQKGVPITVFRLERVVSSLAETPKSAILAFPSLVTRIFPDLMSYEMKSGRRCHSMDLLVRVKIRNSEQHRSEDILNLPLTEKSGLLIHRVGKGAAVSELHHNLKISIVSNTAYPQISVFIVATVVANNVVAVTFL